MIRIILLLFLSVQHIAADQIFHCNIAIIPELQEEIVDDRLIEPEFQRVALPMAIISKCVAGIAGGCCGRYVVSSYDISESEIAMITVASAITSMISIGLLLQNKRAARIANDTYRSCTRKIDQLADDFI